MAHWHDDDASLNEADAHKGGRSWRGAATDGVQPSTRAARSAVSYDELLAHGLRAPTLADAAAPRALPPLPPPADVACDTAREPQLVKNEAGRWELQRVGDETPPAALKRPGAELAAAQRKRMVRNT
jgi:hypothetical protein